MTTDLAIKQHHYAAAPALSGASGASTLTRRLSALAVPALAVPALAVPAMAVMAMLAVATPARADLLKDVLGVNPFKSGGEKSYPADDDDEEIVCPRVDVFEGGGSVRRGEGNGLAYQMTIGALARDCERGPDGRVLATVGVDVRVMLGPSGRPGTFSAPLTIVVRRGDAVLSRQTRQVSLTIPAGEGNAIGSIVERGVVAPQERDVLIEVGFGGAAPRSGKRAR